MKNSIPILILFTFYAYYFAQGQDTSELKALEIIRKTKEEARKNKKLSCTVNVIRHDASLKDSLRIEEFINFRRKENNIIISGKRLNTTTEYIILNNDYYFFDHQKKEYKEIKNMLPDEYPTINLAILFDYFDFAFLRKKQRESLKYLGIEVLNNKEHHVIERIDKMGAVLTLYIDKSSYVLKKTTNTLRTSNNAQYYFEMNISDIKTDTTSIDIEKRLVYRDTYAKQIFKNVKAIGKGKLAPNWTLNIIQNNQKMTLEDLKRKIVVLEFWHISCIPCVKALPYMEKLAQEYKNKDVVILGMNTDENIKKVQEFLTKKNISFKHLETTPKVEKEKYRVTAAPTFYIIDPKGKIIWMREGNLPNNYKVMKRQIDKLLK